MISRSFAPRLLQARPNRSIEFSSRTLAILGAIALSIGALVYLADREPESVYLLPAALSLHRLVADGGTVFGALGNMLPSFVHVYAFSLISFLCLCASLRRPLAVCSAWLAVDCAFEWCQADAIAARIDAAVPDWFSSVPVLANVGPYFSQGTFDPLDLLAIMAGSMAAFFTLLIVEVRDDH